MHIATWIAIPWLLASTVGWATPRRGGDETPRRKTAIADDTPRDEPGSDRPVREKRQDVGTEIYFRAGVAHIQARVSSSGVELQPERLLQLATPTKPVQGSVVTDPTTIITASIGVAPAVFRGYVAIETIIGIPKKTKLRATGDLANKSLAPTALDLTPTGVPPLGEELGEASAVPPMVTVLFRLPALGPLRAYVGGGASVLFVRGARVTNKVLTEVATPKLEVDPAVGAVAQAGIDVRLYKRYHARLDVKEIWFQPVETRITNIHVRTTIPLLETVKVGSARSESTANPLIVQVGVGASF